jgi:hypothetical protein
MSGTGRWVEGRTAVIDMTHDNVEESLMTPRRRQQVTVDGR